MYRALPDFWGESEQHTKDSDLKVIKEQEIEKPEEWREQNPASLGAGLFVIQHAMTVESYTNRLLHQHNFLYGVEFAGDCCMDKVDAAGET